MNMDTSTLRLGRATAISWRTLGTAAALAMVPICTTLGAESQSPVREGTGSASQTIVLEELLITSRRVTERLQDTPIAISSISSESLTRSGIPDLKGIATITPNLSINPAKQSKSLSSFIRGVGQDEDFFTFQPAVGFYLDDVYQGTLFGAGFDLLDIERVEVVRGPQGTLFGKNTEGGAVRVFTREPTGDGSGYVEAGFGSFNRNEVRAAADLTLIPEKLLLRVSGGGTHAEGYNDVIDFPCVNPAQAGTIPGIGLRSAYSDCVIDKLGDVNIVAVRATMKYIASPDLSISIRGDYMNDKSSAAPDKLVAINPTVLNNLNNTVFVPRYGIRVDERFLTGPEAYSTYGSFVDPGSGRRMPLRNTAISRGLSGTINWRIPAGIQMTSITAYRKSYGDAGWDTDNTPMVLNHSYRQYEQDQFSQELLFTGDAVSKRMRWTLGGFYFTQNVGGAALVLTGPAGVGLAASYSDTGEDKSSSVFGHVVFDVTDALHLELGLRHSKEDRRYTFIRDYFALFGAPTIVPTKTDNDRNDYRAGLSFDLSEDAMVYASVSTGYKAGGFNPRPVFPSQITSFDPETVRAYELGLKSSFLDRRLRMNLATFLSKYKDVQKPAFQASTCQGTPPVCSPTFVFSNVGDAEIKGLEAELEAIPVEGLRLNATFGYTNFKYTTLNQLNPPGGATLTSKAPFVPERQFALGAEYEFDFAGGSRLVPRLDYMHRSLVYFGAANLSASSQPGYGLMNARLTWHSPDGTWTAALAATNVADEFYYTYMGETLNSIGIVNGQPGRPRELRLSVRRQF
jgi:iron complex outermembrane receptor protein